MLCCVVLGWVELSWFGVQQYGWWVEGGGVVGGLYPLATRRCRVFVGFGVGMG